MDNECRVPVCAAVDADDARIISYSDGAREGTGGLALWSRRDQYQAPQDEAVDLRASHVHHVDNI